MLAPAGALSRLNVNVFAGRSASAAEAVNASGESSFTVLSPIAASRGAMFTSLTVTFTGRVAMEVPSLTLTVKLKTSGPWTSVGVHENSPVEGWIDAPDGAPTKL